MTPQEFRRFLRDPATGPRLTALLAANAKLDAELAAHTEPQEPVGPRQCCVDYAYVTACDGVTDAWVCGICSRSWTARCPDADLWRPED